MKLCFFLLFVINKLTKNYQNFIVRTGLVTAEEIAQFVPNPWDPRITHLFEESKDPKEGIEVFFGNIKNRKQIVFKKKLHQCFFPVFCAFFFCSFTKILNYS